MQQKNPGSQGYPEFNQLNLPAIEKVILKFWQENKIFEQSVSSRPEDKRFVFYEGPPSANGKPGIHHVMSRTIKDLFCRFKTLQGYRVERKAGWDTHGLPVELSVEKQLGITKADIGVKISVAEYNKLCREDVMKYTGEWSELTTKMGYWVDLDHPYVTYENNYIESLWALLKMLYDKELLYEGYTIQPYSPAAGTGLSSHELNQPDCYRNVKDVSAIAMFKVIKDLKSKFLFDSEDEDVRFLAWTTTPWTLPSNTALAVGTNIRYVKAKTINFYNKREVSVIIAADLLEKTFEWNNLEIKKAHDLGAGKNLEGIRYEQLLPYTQPKDGDAFRVVTGDFVTTSDGTGIVHIAPSFGSDDFKVAKQNGIGSLTLVDKQGRFTDEVNDPLFPLDGRFVKEDYYTDEEKEQDFHLQKEILRVNNIINDLKSHISVDELLVLKLKLENKLFKTEKYEHNYPHCWRTDKPVIYYPLDSWFIRTTAIKDKLIELNKTINWKPKSTGEGRFGQWLENLVDWNLSRSRYWGTPLPIWLTEDGTEEKCIGSIEELEVEVQKAMKVAVMNKNAAYKNEKGEIELHKPYVDEIILVAPSGKPMKRVPDLIDVWFDSGAMPYAQWHWPGAQTPEGGFKDTSEKDTSLRWKTANPLLYWKLKEFAKEGRNNQTQAEEILWNALSGKKISGYKFRRQHIIQDVIVDFVNLPKKLVVEVDGGYHNNKEQQELDNTRSEFLSFLGYKVIRFTNEEVRGDIDGVLDKIFVELSHRPTTPKIGYNKTPFGGLGAGGVFPADFIAEGVDQTRGWFFTLHVLAAALFDSVAYKNVVSNGLLLDKAGNKMSKRLGNVIDPFETLEKYSADATRWYMMRNSDPWENMKFDVAGLQEITRSHFGTLYNTYAFFALYANIDGWKIYETKRSSNTEVPELDRWIISKLQSLIKEVSAYYEDYEPTKAARAIEKFVDEHLSNWYVRLSRRIFWKGEMSADKNIAYETLYECLNIVAQLMSPIAPFFSEWLYGNLTNNIRETAIKNNTVYRWQSVHLTELVKADENRIDKDLEERMDLAQLTCSLVLSLRKKEKIKVRQPLQKIMLPVMSEAMKAQFIKVENYILSEVNVKAIEYISDASGIVKKKIKPNFRELGKKAGSKMKALQAAIVAFTQDDLQKLEREKIYPLNLEGTPFNLELGDVEITSEDIPGWLVASQGAVTVALDVTITDELRNEGTAREFVNKVQNLRKDKDFKVLDRIKVSVVKNHALESALAQFKDYISNEILAKEISIVDMLPDFDEVELNEEILKVKVELVNGK